jgi:hypothetical protein
MLRGNKEPTHTYTNIGGTCQLASYVVPQRHVPVHNAKPHHYHESIFSSLEQYRLTSYCKSIIISEQPQTGKHSQAKVQSIHSTTWSITMSCTKHLRTHSLCASSHRTISKALASKYRRSLTLTRAFIWVHLARRVSCDSGMSLEISTEIVVVNIHTMSTHRCKSSQFQRAWFNPH